MNNWVNFYTAEQLENVFRGWNVKEPLPPKGQCVRVAFPPPRGASPGFNMAVVTVHTQKSTYGEKLYKVELQTVAQGEQNQSNPE